VSHHEELEKQFYNNVPTKPITLKQKIRWLSIECSEFEHIKVIGLDTSNITFDPQDGEKWKELLCQVVPEAFDVIFSVNSNYMFEDYSKDDSDTVYQLISSETHDLISTTDIRKNPYKHWDDIPSAVKEHFVKRILITGTESCGKTTLTKLLAKMFSTAWSREEGRYYSTNHMGGNESVFELEDFYKICWKQREMDEHAIRTANKIVFFDTDAVITQYYCQLYMGKENPKIESLIDPERYDLILFLRPDVKWVADGFRLNGDDFERWELHTKLLGMYQSRGFEDKIIEIGGDYHRRLTEALQICKTLIEL
jgi:HTH-type transcriptional repressor of NAD biosynthesis genes